MKKTVEIHVSEIRHGRKRFIKVSIIDIETCKAIEDYFCYDESPKPPLFRWDNNMSYIRSVKVEGFTKRIYSFLYDTASAYMKIYGKVVNT